MNIIIGCFHKCDKNKEDGLVFRLFVDTVYPGMDINREVACMQVKTSQKANRQAVRVIGRQVDK